MSGRSEAIEGVEAHIGLFTNTLPVRLRLRPDQPLLEQLANVQQRQIRLLEHDGVGLGEIQRLCGVPNLFDTLLVVENYPEDAKLFAADFGGLRCVGARNRGYTHYPLTLMVLPGRELELRLEYREGVKEPERIARRVTRLLEQIVDRPDAPLSAMDVLLPEERDLLARVNTTKVANHPSTLCELLADQAQCTPDAIALVDADHALSYREVRRQVTALARNFAATGVTTGDIVAIALPRSVRLVIALMAAQEAGAAYLPLDTSYPEERLAYMVQDARLRLIVTTRDLQERFEQLGASLVYDELLDGPIEDSLKSVIRPSPDDAAYVIYTSGSTGRPKGVTVSHKAIVNRLRWMQHEYRLSADDVILQKTPSSFDVSVWEFFWPLITGARLVVAPPEAHRDPRELLRLIQDHRVSVIHFVPSMLATFVATANPNPAMRRTPAVCVSSSAAAKRCRKNWLGPMRRCSARRCIISTVRQRRLSTSPINRPAELAQTTLLRRPAFPSASPCGTQACGFSTVGCGRRRSKSRANFIFPACNLPMVTSAAHRSRPVASSPILLRTARECIAQAISSAGSRTAPSNILVEPTTRSRSAVSGSNSAKSKACCWSSPASRRPQSLQERRANELAAAPMSVS